MWRGVISSAAVALSVMAVAAAVAQPAAASSRSQTRFRDRRTTFAFLRIQNRLWRTMLAHRTASRSTLASFVGRVGEQCPGALANAPAGRQLETVGAEIGMSAAATWLRPDRQASREAARAIDRLHWRDQKYTRWVHSLAAIGRAEADFHAADLCGDLKAWVDSGYRRLAPATRTSGRVQRDSANVAAKYAGVFAEVLSHYRGERARRLVRRGRRLRARLLASYYGEVRAAVSKLAVEL